MKGSKRHVLASIRKSIPVRCTFQECNLMVSVCRLFIFVEENVIAAIFFLAAQTLQSILTNVSLLGMSCATG